PTPGTAPRPVAPTPGPTARPRKDPEMQITIGDHEIEFGPKTLRLSAESTEPPPYEHLELRPVTPYIGAEISGVDLAAPTPAQIDELRRALLERKVLFFRDQQHITAR